VPFELGRPLGAPGNRAFQMKVLRALLALFERDAGPVLEDFPEDAPGGPSVDRSGWVCPVNLAPPPLEAGDGLRGAVLAEIESLMPWYALGLEHRGRTTVGLSGLGIEDAARFLAGFVEDPQIENPCPGQPMPQALKHAAEDLKAWYTEAATARPGAAASRAIADWFWTETAAGRLLLELCSVCRNADDPALQRLGDRSLLPRVYQHLLA